jgi:hypothetical protein
VSANGGTGDSIDPLLKRADMALYEAKLTGRDRVVEASDEFTSPGYSSAGRPVRAVRRGGQCSDSEVRTPLR